MASPVAFSVREFLENPSTASLDACKKKDLLSLAEHFEIVLPRTRRKQEIKLLVFDKLVSEGILVQAGLSGTAESLVESQSQGAEVSLAEE